MQESDAGRLRRRHRAAGTSLALVDGMQAIEREVASGAWAAWDSLVEATGDAGFQQSSWWADFRATCGYGHFAITLKSGGVPVGGALVLRWEHSEGGAHYHIVEGPVLPSEAADAQAVFEAVLAGVERERSRDPVAVSHLRLEPRWTSLPAFVSGFREVDHRVDRFVEPRHTVCVDLSPDDDAILAQMHPKGRYNIRLAQRHGVRVERDSSACGVAEFVRIYEATAERQGMRGKPPDYFEDLIGILGARGCGELFFASCRGERLAAVIAVFWGGRATYFFGGSLARHREVMAPYALHWEIMRHAKARGCESYDLWGVAPPEAVEHPWRNISMFKRKFGGTELRFVPTLDLVYDGAAYERYARAERSLALALASP